MSQEAEEPPMSPADTNVALPDISAVTHAAEGAETAGGLGVTASATAAAPPAVFTVRDLAVYYASFRAVRDVQLDIARHQITAFIGPSGCGKTTVLRCFNRMNDLITTARVEGSLLYHGLDLYGPDISAPEV